MLFRKGTLALINVRSFADVLYDEDKCRFLVIKNVTGRGSESKFNLIGTRTHIHPLQEQFLTPMFEIEEADLNINDIQKIVEKYCVEIIQFLAEKQGKEIDVSGITDKENYKKIIELLVKELDKKA
ncbi:hypothetical protein KJ786_02595 [Patescibacteria group bacterium]|nr:hypothetical protein [Patescibacteria group bacterium]